MRQILLSFFAIILLSSCVSWLPDAYKYPVTQGNTINKFQLSQLYVGMSIKKLNDILGTPLLKENNQKNSRIYYYYETEAGIYPTKMSEVELKIGGDKLININTKSHQLKQDD
ncbi:MAG: hypothetical protein DRQ51_03130 [Gammaproteobacteria bacterium]|nr:MAG: hypothetical protein DRQ51_03130 [Gammaproteobacteria bacterium]